jgi:hypothetical protein
MLINGVLGDINAKVVMLVKVIAILYMEDIRTICEMELYKQVNKIVE